MLASILIPMQATPSASEQLPRRHQLAFLTGRFRPWEGGQVTAIHDIYGHQKSSSQQRHVHWQPTTSQRRTPSNCKSSTSMAWGRRMGTYYNHWLITVWGHNLGAYSLQGQALLTKCPLMGQSVITRRASVDIPIASLAYTRGINRLKTNISKLANWQRSAWPRLCPGNSDPKS